MIIPIYPDFLTVPLPFGSWAYEVLIKAFNQSGQPLVVHMRANMLRLLDENRYSFSFN